jgi:hypothetical protein
MGSAQSVGGGEAFDDIIDGYFPLQVSLTQMLARKGFYAAHVTLSHAPIMDIPDLPPNAPVPLNIRSGRAGLIIYMSLDVTLDGLSGSGRWRWLGESNPPGPEFDPLTRLAEPAFLIGTGYRAGAAANALPLGKGHPGNGVISFADATEIYSTL